MKLTGSPGKRMDACYFYWEMGTRFFIISFLRISGLDLLEDFIWETRETQTQTLVITTVAHVSAVNTCLTSYVICYQKSLQTRAQIAATGSKILYGDVSQDSKT